MHGFYQPLLSIHVFMGLVALVLFWAALMQRKGSGWHRRLGRAYVRWMVAAMATALGLVGMVATWPLLIHPAGAGLDASAIAEQAREVREFSLFLGEVALITLGTLWLGVRAVRGPRARGLRWPALDVAVPLAFVLFGISALASVGDGHGVLGVGILMGSVLVGPQSAQRRLRDHLVGILFSATAAHTAFVVSVVPRVFPGIYERDPQVQAAPWVVPILIGILGILYALWRYGRMPREPRGLHGPRDVGYPAPHAHLQPE